MRERIPWDVLIALVLIPPAMYLVTRAPVTAGIVVVGFAFLGLMLAIIGPAKLGVTLVLAGLVTCTWNAVKIGGFTAGDPLLLAGGMILLAAGVKVAAPKWTLLAAGSAVLAWLSVLVAPVGPYLQERQSPVVFGVTQGGAGASDTSNLLRLLLAMLVVPVIVALAARSGRVRARTLGDAWALSAIISAAVALSDSNGTTSMALRLLGPINSSGRESGLTVTPNHLAVSAVLVTPIVLSWLGRKAVWRLAALAAVALLGTGVYLSGSAGGAVGFALAIVLSFALQPALRHRLRYLTSLVIGALIVAAANPAAVTKAMEVSRLDRAEGTQAQSDALRGVLAHQAKEDFLHRPVTGIGLAHIADGHRVILQLLASGGLLLALGVAAWAFCAVRSGRRHRHDPTAAAATVSLLVFVALGVVENQVVDRYIYISVGLIVAAVVAARVSTEQDVASPKPPARARNGRVTAGSGARR